MTPSDNQAETEATEGAAQQQSADDARELIPHLEEPAWGWTRYAERINGRFAMLGFVALLAIELATGQGLLAWLELR
ncbi:MAG: chlorophyll A-B-binding protein [Cyanobacteria bacterium QS_8_64_29]|jgi:hypothetical protein|nr:MAG: chlorophyll A-B-binding protein [Cyanobacteria bacterium QS_8_64_29]